MNIRQITDIEANLAILHCLLVKSCEANSNRYTADQCIEELLRKEKLVWMADSIGLAVVQVIQFPNKICGIIDACAGERFSEWGEPMLSQIEEWMRGNGCGQIMVIARKGFSPFFKSMGYENNQSLFEKEL